MEIEETSFLIQRVLFFLITVWLHYRCSFLGISFVTVSVERRFTDPPSALPGNESARNADLKPVFKEPFFFFPLLFESRPCCSSRKTQQACEAGQPSHIPLKSSSIARDAFHSSVHPSGESIIWFCLLASPIAAAMLQLLLTGVRYMAIQSKQHTRSAALNAHKVQS